MSRPAHDWEVPAIQHMKIEDIDENQPKLANLPPIVDASEAERIVESLEKFQLNQVGTSKWLEQHRKIERLNLQAHQNAMSNSDEFILEAFLTFNKLDTLFHNLLIIEIWKDNVFPLLKNDLAGKNNMRLYFILYHEATLVNLLEIFFYYKHCLESCSDKLIDIIDYVSRKLVRLNDPHYNFRSCNSSTSTGSSLSAEDLQATAKEFAEKLSSRSPLEELEQHWLEIELRIGVACISLARFLCEHADILSLSCLSRITDTHDYLILIIPLIENPQWTRRLENGKWQKLIDLKWTPVQPIDLLKITKLEGQPWITLYHLIAKKEFRERYNLNSFRKGQLLRIRKYINEIMLDQLPFLADIQRYMDELTVMNVPEPNSLTGGSGNVFLFQQVAPLYDTILKGKNFQSIANEQKESVFVMTDSSDKDLLSMAELYSDDSIEHVFT
jgi:hypothetical protein